MSYGTHRDFVSMLIRGSKHSQDDFYHHPRSGEAITRATLRVRETADVDGARVPLESDYAVRAFREDAESLRSAPIGSILRVQGRWRFNPREGGSEWEIFANKVEVMNDLS